MANPACQCEALTALAVVDMGDHEQVFATLDELRRRSLPYWWISAHSCRACGQEWLVGQDERHNDIFCMRRLGARELEAITRDDSWPSDFDRYETLLRIGRDAGRAVRYFDPLRDSCLDVVISELARERPGIRIDELASLLNIDAVTTREIVDRLPVEVRSAIDSVSR
jgi:hypothetical protein